MNELVKVVTYVVAAIGLLATDVARAQDKFPSRPITAVIPLPPGGSADPVMRLVGKQMEESIKQPIVIDNRPGGGGNIAANYVKQAEPSGYTLIMGNTSTHAVNATMFANPGFDPIKDFQPITTLVSLPLIVVVPASSPAKSMAELAAFAKTKPGGLTFGSQGVGSGAHLLGEMFKRMVGVPMVHVPYRGAAPAIQDLLAARVDVVFATYLSAGAHVEVGKLRILAVTAGKRSPLIPNIPTTAEAGFPGLEYELWYGMLAPAGTPAPVIKFLNQEFVKAARTPAVVEMAKQQGADVVANTPDEFAKLIASDMARLGKVVKDAGIKAD
jgi:tripartite-type tricarboxylate transporter receptor subunit TctC